MRDGQKEVGVEESGKTMYQEMGVLARHVQQTLCELSDGASAKGQSVDPLTQSGHLTDLKRLTEDGTHTVMKLTEEIQDTHALMAKTIQECIAQLWKIKGADPCVAKLNEVGRMLAGDDAKLMEIVTALSFQDLVAQRIRKIVTIVDDVQLRLLEMVVTHGDQQDTAQVHDTGRAGAMLKELEESKTVMLKQDLVDDILAQYGFN
jgi:chemotaxis protein CheZ